jgi:hypothetical protein
MEYKKAKEIAELYLLIKELNENVKTLQDKFSQNDSSITIIQGCNGGREIDIPRELSGRLISHILDFHDKEIENATEKLTFKL